MKKNLFFAALAFVALASCTSDEFVGDNTPPTTSNTAGAIQFTSNAPRITRAAGTAADAETLGYSFNVYATKTVTENNSDVTSNVFALNAIGSPDGTTGNHTPYQVWYTDNSANKTSSNTSGWDYVGIAATGDPATPKYGDGNITLSEDQTIKYWDYSAKQYDFVAYKATEGTPTITNYTKDGFTVVATAAQLAGLYVADKVTLKSSVADNVDNNPTKPATSINKIGGIVQFTFRSAATKVRLGIYETIPGYDVKNVSFRPNASEFTATTDNAILSGSFNGSSSSASGTYNVTYNATSGIAEFDNTATSTSGYFDFGRFTSSTKINEASINPTWANNGSYEYLSVLPNTDNYGNMVLYVDYDLYNTVSHETIHVKGAKAVVPAIYMIWNPNYAYTYLFKISDNTNGTTGTESGQNPSPQGLYPITFDALTIAGTNDEVGTITTVSTPAITTYQKGSVVDKEETAVSEHGITYAAGEEPIYITVNTAGTLEELTLSNTKLYKLAAADADATEADLILAPSKLTDKEVTGDDKLSLLSDEVSVQGITFATSTTVKFSPAAGQTYAVEFSKDAVSEAYVAATGTYVSGTTYYTDNTGATTVDTSSFVAGETSVASYYVKRDASAAVKVYKVIKVAAATPEP